MMAELYFNLLLRVLYCTYEVNIILQKVVGGVFKAKNYKFERISSTFNKKTKKNCNNKKETVKLAQRGVKKD